MMILSTKLKNAIAKCTDDSEYLYTIKNISINGVKKGCSGFIRNKMNGAVVYVTTEEPCLTSLHYMYRYADSEKDYKGYHNRWADTFEELVRSIIELLNEYSKDKDRRM